MTAPKGACEALHTIDHGTPLLACAADDAARVGEWSYALVAPQFEVREDISADELAKLWAGDTLQMSAETAAALTTRLGPTRAAPVEGRPEVGKRWAIVPAHELLPAWKIVTVAGKHPLTDVATQALTVPLCAPGAGHLTNIDANKLTVMTMTGTTAMTRMMGPLLDKKGAAYAAKDVADWFKGADFIHVSNEVSYVPECKTGKATMEFCSRESYIEALEAIHANVIELTGSHLSDYGSKWLDHTTEMYKARGMRWFGGGHDQIQGSAPLVFDHHGNHFAIVGCNMVRTTSHLIRDRLPDTSACDLPRMEWQIRDLRAHGILPLISIQHEEVYRHDPPDVVVEDFRRLAKAGAAFVFGSQAHCAHPWEVHDGAFLHYGAGNFWFDQDSPSLTDGTVDRLYLYDNRLLSVGHLYTHLEERGKPRPLTLKEREEFLATITHTHSRLPKADPWGAMAIEQPARTRPDSIVWKQAVLPFNVFVPKAADPQMTPGGGKKDGADNTFALTISLRVKDTTDAPGFVIAPRKKGGESWSPKLIERITEWAVAKYPIDPAKITVLRD